MAVDPAPQADTSTTICKSSVPAVKSSSALQALKRIVDRAIAMLGNSKESLCATWIGRLCILNAVLHVHATKMQLDEKRRFPVKHGQPKIASFGVMNGKYVGIFKAALAMHILGGNLSVVGSAASMFFEERRQSLSKKLAILASAGEVFLHAPSAIFMSPIVYGDKGITPPVYMVTSLLLLLSGTSALFESTSDESPGPKGMEKRRPELRRMCTTVNIFLYVRLYAQMRGANRFLSSQKYALASVMAGFTMLPLGWDRCIYPLSFWGMFFYNFRTVMQTGMLIDQYGVDGAAARQVPWGQLSI